MICRSSSTKPGAYASSRMPLLTPRRGPNHSSRSRPHKCESDPRAFNDMTYSDVTYQVVMLKSSIYTLRGVAALLESSCT